MEIDLSNAQKLQEIKGWGTSACWWSQACPKGEITDDIVNLLYSKQGLNLNIYRYNVGGGVNGDDCRIANPWRKTESFLDFDTEKEEYSWDFSRDENAVNVMKRALELGNIDTLIFFANSPHWSHCSTGQASGSFLYHTCNIPKMNYKKFVDYFLDVTQHFIDEGFPVKYVSPINEPQWKWGGKYVWQEGCHYETQELVEIYHLFAEEILRRNMSVKLYGPESGEILGLTPEYLKALSEDETIMKVLDVFAFHSYHADDNPSIRTEFKQRCVDVYPELRFDMSEWCELPNKSHTKDFKGALITARIIGQDIALAGAESWTSWVAVNNFAINEDGFDYSDAMITANHDFSEWYVAERYYALAHFSKYIPVGSYCLDLGISPDSEHNTFNAFGFETPDGETVFAIVNESDERSVEIVGDFSNMKIIESTAEKKLNVIHNGEALKKITAKKNSILTVITK